MQKAPNEAPVGRKKNTKNNVIQMFPRPNGKSALQMGKVCFITVNHIFIFSFSYARFHTKTLISYYVFLFLFPRRQVNIQNTPGIRPPHNHRYTDLKAEECASVDVFLQQFMSNRKIAFWFSTKASNK